MSKRAVSEIDEYEQKPDLTSSDEGSGANTHSSNKGKKIKKPRIKKEKDSGENGGRAQIRLWTAEEDRIFLEIMGNLVKAKMWEAVSSDGRLAYRGCPGIRAHVIAMMNKIKRS